MKKDQSYRPGKKLGPSQMSLGSHPAANLPNHGLALLSVRPCRCCPNMGCTA
jgi:hypothetical protein